tara:strand:- start:51 stop:1034 length:984 start_codon:yes stop_codon:yes gene_type:complete
LRKLKVALIGCGVVGLRRVKYFGKNFSLIACADKKINKLKKIFTGRNIILTNDWKKILKIDNLDAVFIATYHSSQNKIIEAFIKKKIHIFCEKPGGTSHKETLKLLNLIKRKKKICIKIGYNHRFHPGFILAKKIISKNEIGKIMYIRGVYGHGGRKDYHKEWRFNKKLSGGGELIDKGSHLIDLSRFFLGNLNVHSSFLTNYFWKTKLEDNCFITLKNNNNNFSFLHASSTEWKNKFLFEIFCKKGKIEICGLGKSYGSEKLILYKMKKNMGIPEKKEFNFSKLETNNSWKIEINEFYQSIIKSKNSFPNLYDVYNNLKIINKIYK